MGSCLILLGLAYGPDLPYGMYVLNSYEYTCIFVYVYMYLDIYQEDPNNALKTYIQK